MEPLALESTSRRPERWSSEPAAALLAEMTEAWRRGRRLGVEELLGRHPEVAADREAVLRLIYEEVCLREEAGQAGATAEVLARFPQHRAELEVLLDCRHLLEDDGRPPAFPEAGEQLGEFRLLAELGRGARGRVFLASQPALADRPLVVKLTPSEGEEHLALARLQHAHIVPLYFVAEWPDRGLQGLCMPYVGGLSLAALLGRLRDVAPPARTGQHLLAALRDSSSLGEVQQAFLAPPAPLRRFLGGATFAQAVCWVGAGLADALHHAHERGLVHLDLKPDNVLLAADGAPMLLDFHLARAPLAAGGPADRVGGTPGYMPPEQQAALEAVRAGRPLAAAVDARADVFALGALLYEALGGADPRPQAPADVARALRRNPQVSVGLADVVGRCLAPPPGRRYADAAALAADLRRHLADLPLEGVANRSLVERWRKWRRRRGQGAAPLRLVLAASLAVAAAAWAGLTHRHQALSDARGDLEAGRGMLRQRRHDEAARALRRGQARLRGLPAVGGLPGRLAAERRRAERGAAADELHAVVEHLRFQHGSRGPTPEAELRKADDRCRACWALVDRLLDRDGAELAADLEARVREDLLDLAVLWADLRSRGASRAARQEALRLLEDAAGRLGPSAALAHERRAHARALGLTRGGAEEARPPRTAWEHHAVGRSLLRAGELAAARTHLERALRQRPNDFWINFTHGLCCYQDGGYHDALAAFHACVALAPDCPECYFNRALARAALGEAAQAVRDYSRALGLRPGLAEAALNRGLLHFRAGRHADAVADLRRALEAGAEPAGVHFNLALVYEAQGRRGEALANLERALRQRPDHAAAREMAARLRGPGGG